MKHLGNISVVRTTVTADPERVSTGTSPGFADAKNDFLNAIWAAWWDYVDAKKNELSV